MFKKNVAVNVAKDDAILVIEVLYDHGIEIGSDFEVKGDKVTLDCWGTNSQFNAVKKEMEKLNRSKFKLHNGDAITL